MLKRTLNSSTRGFDVVLLAIDRMMRDQIRQVRASWRGTTILGPQAHMESIHGCSPGLSLLYPSTAWIRSTITTKKLSRGRSTHSATMGGGTSHLAFLVTPRVWWTRVVICLEYNKGPLKSRFVSISDLRLNDKMFNLLIPFSF